MERREFEVNVRSGGTRDCEWSLWKLPDPLFGYVKQQVAVASAERKDYKQKLLGHISSSYHVKDPDAILLNHILQVVNNHSPAFKKLVHNCLTASGLERADIESEVKFALDDLWVNYQKKYEFNPLHCHGGILSFVIWVQIPYDINEELALDIGKHSISEEPLTSKFQFVFPGANGQLAQVSIPVSKDYEGVICTFPAFLQHQVFPFYTSDEERISVAGNIRFRFDGS